MELSPGTTSALQFTMQSSAAAVELTLWKWAVPAKNGTRVKHSLRARAELSH